MPVKLDRETKLKKILNDRGITLQRLSDIISEQDPGYVLGIDRLSRISNTGKGLNIHLQVAIKIAKALGCSLDDICDDMG
jgi:DNA-binding Xre family transcriptional regulator